MPTGEISLDGVGCVAVKASAYYGQRAVIQPLQPRIREYFMPHHINVMHYPLFKKFMNAFATRRIQATVSPSSAITTRRSGGRSLGQLHFDVVSDVNRTEALQHHTKYIPCGVVK